MPHSPTSSSSMTLSSFSTRTTPRCQTGSKTLFVLSFFLSRPFRWPPGLFQDQNNSMNCHWSIQNIGDVLLITIDQKIFHFYVCFDSHREKNLDADPCREDPEYSFQARHFPTQPWHEIYFIYENTIKDGGSTALYSAYIVYTAYTVYTFYTVNIVLYFLYYSSCFNLL